MRALLLTAVLLLPLLPVQSQTLPLPAGLSTILSSPAAARTHWGISVLDAATGAVLLARDDDKLFQPASNAKLFTTAATVALLGPGYAMQTRVLAEGRVDPDGILHGDIRLLGGGDPTLSGRSYPYAVRSERSSTPLLGLTALATQVSANGIHAITGSVIADDTLFPDERYGAAWCWDDLQWEYGAPVSALPINDDVHYLALSPGAAPGAPLAAAWTPDLPGHPKNLVMTATTSAINAAPALGITGQTDALRIYGSLPLGAQPVHLALALDDPAQIAAEAFQAALRNGGIAVAGQTGVQHRLSTDVQSFAAETRVPVVLHALPPGTSSLPNSADTQLLAQRQSPPLSEIITVINKVSQNLHAELLLRLLGRAEGDDGSSAQGARIVRAWATTQAHILPDDFILYDGSGLSTKDLVTPRALTSLLHYSMSQPWGPLLRASLPVAGVDGSLTARLTSLRGRVQAKTGTLSETDALSGFLTADSGRLVIFSILCNDSPAASARPTIDALVTSFAHSF